MEQYRSARNKIILYTKGIAMGGADIIPGVSGGTIALISGIYEHLITALSQPGFSHLRSLLSLLNFANRDHQKRSLRHIGELQWHFLIPLLLGIGTGIGTMSKFIPQMMEEYPFYTYAFFFGLILFSLTIPFRMMRHGIKEFALLFLFAAATFVVVGFSRVSNATILLTPMGVDSGEEHPGTKEALHLKTDNKGKWNLELPASEGSPLLYKGVVLDSTGTSAGSFRLNLSPEGTAEVSDQEDLDGLTLFLKATELQKKESGNLFQIQGTLFLNGSRNPLVLFFSGALSICAMILPGISGAYILVLLGEYRVVLEALHNGQFLLLASFLSGILVGILSFIRLLKFMLKRYHSLTMAALTGIMLGSLRKIWPLTYLEGSPSVEVYWIGAGIALFGAILVFLLEFVSKRVKDPEPPY